MRPMRGLISTSGGSPASRARVMRSCMMLKASTMTLDRPGRAAVPRKRRFADFSASELYEMLRFRQAILVCCAVPVSITSANSTNVLKVGDRGGHTWQCICGRGRGGLKARDARNDLRRDEFRDLLGAWPSHGNSG